MGDITRTNFGLTTNLNITNAQMLVLHDTPLVIVPARAGTIWVPLLLEIISNTTAGAYATVATFQLGVTGSLTLWGTITLADSHLNAGAKSFSVTGSNILGGTVVGGAETVANGLPVVISANANPTGGDPTNVIQVRLHFVEVPSIP